MSSWSFLLYDGDDGDGDDGDDGDASKICCFLNFLRTLCTGHRADR